MYVALTKINGPDCKTVIHTLNNAHLARNVFISPLLKASLATNDACSVSTRDYKHVVYHVFADCRCIPVCS